jgi:hypothetical protein
MGIAVCKFTLDRIYIKLGKANHGEGKPEYRLPVLLIGAFTLPLIVALYGWIAELKLPVVLLLINVLFMGFSLLLGIVPMMSYVVDAFGEYSASAMTAVLITRCLASTFIPLGTMRLSAELGYGWGFMITGTTLFVLAPIPVLVMWYGDGWRQYSSYTRTRD